MRPETLGAALSNAAPGAGPSVPVICEGVMGLFDGACLEDGSTADLAARMGWPVVLVVDASAQGASAVAVVEGFARHRADLKVSAVVFNRIGSPRHRDLLARAMAASLPDVAVLGALPRVEGLVQPSRHLGLVQAREMPALETFLERAAALVGEEIDVERLLALAMGSGQDGALDQANGRRSEMSSAPLPPLGQRIAVADDHAFAFRYPHVLDGWRAQGAEISFFSPLADEAPAADADAVYLPGGYPELHAGELAANRRFLGGLRDRAQAGVTLFGECGGYMVLGQGLEDANGTRHAMAGLLPLETSFKARRLHLGYRRVSALHESPLGGQGCAFKGHEFHYATVVSEGPGAPLFEAWNAEGAALGAVGRYDGSVFGSFVHLIDRASD